MVTETVLTQTVQRGKILQVSDKYNQALNFDLVRARIVQQNADRGRQDHFHFFGREACLF